MGVFIPEKCRVGWRNRTDTYTKKLAYIIYYDEKGKIRKETSWEGWRDKSIEPQDIDNVPFDGFLLNKGIQRCNYGHFSSGRSLVRIFDPRLGGIEFEVSIDNLLYILMHDDCTKRELIGKYVYAWDGKDLVLLPVSSDDYIAATENTRLRKSKVSSKTLVAGHTYLNKAGDSMVYIGRFEGRHGLIEENGIAMPTKSEGCPHHVECDTLENLGFTSHEFYGPTSR